MSLCGLFLLVTLIHLLLLLLSCPSLLFPPFSSPPSFIWCQQQPAVFDFAAPWWRRGSPVGCHMQVCLTALFVSSYRFDGYGVGLLKVHELRLVTAKHTTSECYAIRLRAPIVSDGASGSCRRSFPSLASPPESGEDSYCIFNLHTQVVQTPNRRYSSVYQMWRSCTAIQGCCVHRTYCWSCWKWGRSKFSWYKDWKIWQRQPRRKTDGSSSPHTVCWYTYILNLTSCKDAPDSCYRYSQYVGTSHTHSSTVSWSDRLLNLQHV